MDKANAAARGVLASLVSVGCALFALFGSLFLFYGSYGAAVLASGVMGSPLLSLLAAAPVGSVALAFARNGGGGPIAHTLTGAILWLAGFCLAAAFDYLTVAAIPIRELLIMLVAATAAGISAGFMMWWVGGERPFLEMPPSR